MADWARQDQGNTGKPSTWARRLKRLRSFCRYLQQFEPRTEVPDAAHNLGSTIPGLRGATYGTLFGLIASTGLRISEALHLLGTDVDLKPAMLANT